MFAPGVRQVMEDFHVANETLGSLVISIYVLGLALGPLILAPLSEVYGRLIIYSVTNVLYVIFTVACGVSTDLTMMIVWRFLAGCVGSAPLAIGAGTIADLFPLEQRGLALSLFSLGPIAGPAIGPVIGGFLSQAKGWRWIFWLMTVLVSERRPQTTCHAHTDYLELADTRTTERSNHGGAAHVHEGNVRRHSAGPEDRTAEERNGQHESQIQTRHWNSASTDPHPSRHPSYQNDALLPDQHPTSDILRIRLRDSIPPPDNLPSRL